MLLFLCSAREGWVDFQGFVFMDYFQMFFSILLICEVGVFVIR